MKPQDAYGYVERLESSSEYESYACEEPLQFFCNQIAIYSYL